VRVLGLSFNVNSLTSQALKLSVNLVEALVVFIDLIEKHFHSLKRRGGFPLRWQPTISPPEHQHNPTTALAPPWVERCRAMRDG